MTQRIYRVTLSTYITATSHEQAALLFQDMFQDAEHPGWGIRVEMNTEYGPDHKFIETDNLRDRRDEILEGALDTERTR